MSKRPHPARRARAVTGAGSLAAATLLTGYLGVHAGTTTTVTAAATTTTTVASETTTIAPAQPASPSAVATTTSAGS